MRIKQMTVIGTLAAVVVTAPAAAAPMPKGQFSVRCTFSHRAADDPIVAPGKPGASHMHDFVGNRSTDAASDLGSLREAGTTCRRAGDTSGYWTPTLLMGNREVAPHHAQIYYLTNGRDPASIQPFPAGLKVVAGSDSRIRWACAPGNFRREERRRTKRRRSTTARSAQTSSGRLRNCRYEEHLRGTVIFPDCWNGVDLDSADHRSHMAYSRKRACPSTHPVAVPSLRVNMHYPVWLARMAKLSSGGPETLHADFFSAWQPGVLEDLVTRCLNAARHCGGKS